MKKRIWLLLIIAFLFFSCGANTDSDQTRTEKDRIDNVSDAASAFGYDGEAIEKGLRDVDSHAEEREDAVDEIFKE
jgi:hypothetical protein